MYHDYSCCQDKVNRAAGRRAVVMVFASSSGQFYLDVTNSYHLSGLTHLDNFIMTQNSQPSPGLVIVKTIYRDPKLIVHLPGLAKNAAPRRGRQLN
jgi:hypothetical protein